MSVDSGRSSIKPVAGRIRVALVGCGAVTVKSHIPALARTEGMSITALVDTNSAHAEQLANEIGCNVVCSDMTHAADQFDLAVIATPSATHGDLIKQALNLNKHVLVEKPLATSTDVGLDVIDIARDKQRALAVSLVRRYSPQFRAMAAILETGMLGNIDSFRLHEGGVFGWPVQSPSFFKPEVSGGGVLMDHGAHLLDACIWWFGDFESVTYRDDSRGGVEADCELDLVMASGAVGNVTMSRLRTLSNTLEIEAERANLTMDLITGEMSIEPAANYDAALFSVSNELKGRSGIEVALLFERQYRALTRLLVEGACEDVVRAEDCMGSIRLIEACYQQQNLHDYPSWS